MTTEMPPPIGAYFAAKSRNDIEAMLAPFDEDALVKDEGREIQGHAAIRKWIGETNRKYQYTVEVTGVSEHGDSTTVRCRLVGDFPGSPVDVDYKFALRDGWIRSLVIG